MTTRSETVARTVRVAARALGRAGLVHAYGHCSARVGETQFMVCPSRPLVHVRVGEPCTLVPVEGDLPEGVLGEVRLHQEIYRRRPDVGGVVRFMGPNLMALAAFGRQPQMRHGFGTYFHPAVGLWNDIQLVRDDEKARGVIDAMGGSAGVLMRGNGGVTAGRTLEEAVVLAWYLEDMCRLELAALSSDLAEAAPTIPIAEAVERATRAGRIFERMWDFLTHGDAERGDHLTQS